MFGFRKKSEGAKSPPSPAPAEDVPASNAEQSNAPTADAAQPAEAPAASGGRSWFGFRRSTEATPEAPADAAPAPAAADATEPAAPEQKSSWFSRLRSGLKKTGASLGAIFVPRRIDEALFEELETALLSADAGLEATEHLLKGLRQRVKRDRLETSDQLKAALAEELTALLKPLEVPLDATIAKPFVMMIAGVNGAGKTTSIGKLAKFFREQNLTVLLAAGDTFRAAAREQLAAWGERNGVTVISQDNADPAAVIFDAVGAARARGIDVVIADTAGRLPTQLHLMEELRKVKRVIGKAQADAPHEVMIVLDANNGQNALKQVEAFDAALGVTGIVLTKLDGTAKGGVVAAIALARSKQQGRGPIPLRFVGVGEGLDDLRPFVAADFARALLD
jgi:fused signal recognition particle receptor